MSSFKNKKVIRNNFNSNNSTITPTLDVMNSNNVLIKLLNKQNILISRIGGYEGENSMAYLKRESYPNKIGINNNTGIYTNNDKEIDLWATIYSKCIIQSDVLVCFPKLFIEPQNFYINNFKKSHYTILF